jgi:hypothetical protein
MVLYLGLALLAGATLSTLGQRGRGAKAVALLPVLAALFLLTRIGSTSQEKLADFVGSEGRGGRTLFLLENVISLPPETLILTLAALALVLVYALLPGGRGLVAALLVCVLFADLLSSSRAMIDRMEQARGGGQVLKMDLSAYYGPTGAEEFLRSQTREKPARYFGYGSLAYAVRFADPQTRALLVNNAATPYGLQDVQGYNAVQLALYAEYVAALNGRPQNRHFSDVLPEGLDSPLLDLLNVRYIITPAATSPNRSYMQDLKDTLPTAYKDDRVQILENRDALPRAWIVHSARRATPDEALKLLSSGEVDPRQTALLEREPPALSPPEEPSSDRASVATYEAGRIELNTATGTPGLLVLSEVYYPAWKAYVDGEPAPLYRADHLLRAVPVPAGEHAVELRYESRALKTGVAISLLAYAVLVGLVVAGARRWRKSLTGKEHAITRVKP